MKKILIGSLPPGGVIMDLAKSMDVSYTHHGKEYGMDVPLTWGKGTITAIQFDGGFGLLKYDCTFHEDVEVHFNDANVHPLKFLYCLDGQIGIRVADVENFTGMKKFHNSILTSLSGNGHIVRFPGKKTVRVRSVEIDRTVFHRRFNCEDQDCNSQLQHIFEDHHGESAFCHNGMYSVTLSDLFERLDEYPHDGILRIFFLEGIVLQILSEQFRLYEDDLNGTNEQSILRSYELDLVHKAAGIIEDELEDLETIPVLAHRVGMNVNKIQEGFKQIYNMTVNQYIHMTRMKQAIALLRHSDFNISEIEKRKFFANLNPFYDTKVKGTSKVPSTSIRYAPR